MHPEIKKLLKTAGGVALSVLLLYTFLFCVNWVMIRMGIIP